MRSPRPAFDLRSALTDHIRDAAQQLEEPDAAAVHNCRVALKKARVLVRVGAVGSPGLASLFQDAARTVMHTLAPARDLAAQIDAALAAGAGAGGKRGRALAEVANRLSALMAEAAAPDLEAARAGLKDLMALAQVWPECSEAQLRRGARNLVRRARRARRRGLGSLSPKRRHEWRQREKDRMYAADLFGEAWPARRRVRLAARLADALGHECDIVLLQQRLHDAPMLAGDAKSLKRAMKALKNLRARIAARADALGEELRAHGA